MDLVCVSTAMTLDRTAPAADEGSRSRLLDNNDEGIVWKK
jgi:hypothetical protein